MASEFVDELGLQGKVAIVTGGAAAGDGIGNGRAAAIHLARAGPQGLRLPGTNVASETNPGIGPRIYAGGNITTTR